MNAVPGGVKNVLYYPSEFEVGVERVQQPQDDDRPLPRRTLARISHSSASGLPGSERGVTGDSSGTMLGITHAQLQKLQLADIANMLLPDRTHSIHSQSGGLPFVTVRSEGSASVTQDAASDTTQNTYGINDIYHDAISGKDFSGPLDSISSPSPVRRGLHSRNSLSVGDDGSPFHQPAMGGRDPNRHVWSPMQPQSSPNLPSTPLASRKKGASKALRSSSHHAVGQSSHEPSSSRFAAAVDIEQSHNDVRSTGFTQEVDEMEPVDIEL